MANTTTEDPRINDYRAVHRYARMGVRKARLIADLIRGRTANEALDDLRHDRHRAAVYVRKVLASAVANALQDSRVRANRLVVTQAFANEGPLLQGRLRYRPGPMGRATPIRKRTCHIHVHVADPGVSLASSTPAAETASEDTE